MGRRVVSVRRETAVAGGAPDTYFDKVVKYIPADVVAAWIAVSTMVKAATGVPTSTVMWICFAVGLAVTAAWTWKHTNEPGLPTAAKQIGISTVAFAVWVFALGAPFDSLDWYHALYASLLLVGYTLIVGLFSDE